MHPQPSDVELDILSFFSDGVIELGGRVQWRTPVTREAVADNLVFLRITQRGSDEHYYVEGEVDPEGGAESRFRCRVETREFMYLGNEDVYDLYVVFQNQEGEWTMRVAWPASGASWIAYPTVYGNLSMKKVTAEATAR